MPLGREESISLTYMLIFFTGEVVVAKRKVLDKAYSAPTGSPVVKQVQKLLQAKQGHFAWAQLVDHKEMTFIYDIASKAEVSRDFQPTENQSKWAIAILKKIEGATKQWKIVHGTKSPIPSTREDMVARRLAKERLRSAGVKLSKPNPSDRELLELLNSIEAINSAPTNDNPKDRLITWSKRA
jgi:hypothetical protein